MNDKSFTMEDLKKEKQWNEQAHKVDLVIHTPNGSVTLKTEIMTANQIDELKGSLHSKVTNPHGYLDVKTNIGFVIVPHELLVTSVIQVLIDAPEPPPAPTEKKATKPPKILPPEKG